MTAAAFSSAPSSSSPQPLRIPTDNPSQIFSPFQSQQQQQQLPSAQQPAMMELSAHSGPPSLHQHLDIMGECVCTCLQHSAWNMPVSQTNLHAKQGVGIALCTRRQDRSSVWPLT